MTRALRLVVPLSLLGFAASAHAQDDDGMLPATFSSDRPGFANSTSVAARGRLTTELGVSGSFDDDDQRGELPNLSLRFGVFDWLEARVRGPNGVWCSACFDGADRAGLGDPWVGFKVGGALHERLAVSSVWEVSLPIGTDPFSAPEAQWRADIQADWRFWGPLTLTPNAVASVVHEPRYSVAGLEYFRVFEGGGSLKLTWWVLDVLALYVQSYALVSEHGDWRVQVGGGLRWRVAPNAQVHASFDSRVTDQGDAPTGLIGATILW